MPDFARCAGIHLFAETYELVAFCFVEPKDQLTILLILCFTVFCHIRAQYLLTYRLCNVYTLEIQSIYTYAWCKRKRKQAMSLVAARSLVMRDRLDWNRPHLNWLTDKIYWQLPGRRKR